MATARRILVAWSLVCGLWSAFGQSRTWAEVHWIGWILAAAWATSALVPVLARADVPAHGPRARQILRALLLLAAQNSAQEVLFFTLPFWIRSTTFTSENGPFTVLLVLLAAATLYDPLYERRILAHPRRNAVFRSLVLFAGLDFLLPAVTARSTVECLVLAGAWSGASAGLGLVRRSRGVLWGGISGLLLAWGASRWIAPVPLHMRHPVLCSQVRDHQPVDTLREVRTGMEPDFWTPVFAPPGRSDTIRHVWSRDGKMVAVVALPLHGGRDDGFRTWSNSRNVASAPGAGMVEVRLRDGQLLGRHRFRIAEGSPD